MSKAIIGITQGDTNGIGYEIIFKAFEDQAMFDFCIPVVYGSPKTATFHRKSINSQLNFNVIENAAEAQAGHLNIINCNPGEVAVEFGKGTEASGTAAAEALERAVQDYKEGLIQAIVTAPINKAAIHSGKFPFSGHTEYFEAKFAQEGEEALMILMNDQLKVALATVHEPIKQVSDLITKDLVKRKLTALNRSLKRDFAIEIPRIAVLALNPHAGEEGLLGSEEKEIIIPAMKEMAEEKVNCFGPFPADGFFGNQDYKEFDAILAMYHDQGLIALKTIDMEGGVNYTAGLEVIRTSPDHGTAYEIAGKNVASPVSMRHAIYAAIDIYRTRTREDAIHANPLKKLFFERRDDSDKLKLDAPTED